MNDVMFNVLVNQDHYLEDMFNASELLVYKRKETGFEVCASFQIAHKNPTSRKMVEDLSIEVIGCLESLKCQVIIGKSIVGLPYQLLDRQQIQIFEADEFSEGLLEEIYQDFYVNVPDPDGDIPYAPDKPVMIAEDGFFYFDFDASCKSHPELSSKKMLMPFLEEELFTCLTIKCSHIMPWLDEYLERKGMKMEAKREDGEYTVLITHGLCER